MAAIERMRNSNDSISQIASVLRDQNQPLTERFRALFTLRNLGGKKAINAIAGTFSDPSALLKHELAYCLGQMQDDYAVSILTEVLEDENQEVIVRHEAACSYVSVSHTTNQVVTWLRSSQEKLVQKSIQFYRSCTTC
ncbi:Deoxyhypusine hydroxylase [Octopus vulgaris]|uniref:Deoxyhypusine hydroxylase n=1 Tax=Octopus vulgaris TaxID=6645 RepID=A0AA36F9U0_OCTVU|nr:Deoxyhypusine hydroxylase [Octopus vulgaris]